MIKKAALLMEERLFCWFQVIDWWCARRTLPKSMSENEISRHYVL